VLTNAGGPGVTAADALEALDMQLAHLQPHTLEHLRALLPEAAATHNPVDMLAAATPQQYADCLQILVADETVNSVLVILPPPPMHTAGAVAKAMIPVIHAAGKPVVIALMGERLIQEAVEHFRAARVPEYRFPERAASALAVLARRAEGQADADDQEVRLEGTNPARVRTQLVARQPGTWLPADIAGGIAAAYGIPVPHARLVSSAAQAAAAAEEIGLPVALKVAAETLPHKSDVGGVLLNLTTAAEVQEGYNTILQRVRHANPQAQVEHMYLQQMAPPGQEVILGAVQDAQFGALVMFGSGGVEVEGLRDVDFGLAPLTRRDAEALLENTWAGRKLRGFRSLPPADREAALQALFRLAQLAADFPQLAEIEINPLRVLPAGQGVLALDVRARLGPPQGSE
jgi:acetyltransferase